MNLIYALATALSLAVSPSMAGAHDSLEVTNVFVREPIGGMPTGAAYLTVENHGSAADRLLSVSTPAADKAELHNHEIDAQGIARMRPVPAIEVPAGGAVELKPGGLHIMLMGLKGGLEAGKKVLLTLTFEKAGEFVVQAPVRPMSANGPAGMDHGKMDHGQMDHGQMDHGQMDHGTMTDAPKTTN